MSRLGNAARLRAHMRQIRQEVEKVLEIASGTAPLEQVIGLINEQNCTACSYAVAYSLDEAPTYFSLSYTSLNGLRQTHEEIVKMIKRWECGEVEDSELERAAKQVRELAIMAWVIERKKRGQETGTRYLTLDVDPITIRLLAFIHDEREDREEEGPVIILEQPRLANALRRDAPDSLKKARRTLQRLINQNGDTLIREEYQITQSDIPDLRSISITIENGSARTAVTFYSKSQIDYITDGVIKLRFKMPETQASAYAQKELHHAIQHPITSGLGLRIESVETLSTSEGDVSSLRTDACGRGKLTAMVINMEKT